MCNCFYFFLAVTSNLIPFFYFELFVCMKFLSINFDKESRGLGFELN